MFARQTPDSRTANNSKMRALLSILKDEDGPTAVEYAVMLALIIVVCSTVVQSVGNAAYDSLWEVVEVLD